MPSIKDKRVSPIRTICEVHRDIYDLICENESLDKKTKEKMMGLLEEAYQMAKKMNAKLRQYKNNYDDGWWEMEREKVIKEKLKRRKGK